MQGRQKAYILAIGIVALLTLYWAGSQWWETYAPAPSPPPTASQWDEQDLRSALQELLLGDDTQLLLESLMPQAPQVEELAHQVASHLLHSGMLHDLIHEVMTGPQFKNTIVALVEEPEVQAVIKASIDLDDIQFLMEELLSTPEGQAFIMELLTGLLSRPGN